MLDERQYADLRQLFRTLVLFGDPAQLAPVGGNGAMVFDALPAKARLELSRVHRQAADSPILDLAHALADPSLELRGLRGADRARRRRATRASSSAPASTPRRWPAPRCSSGATSPASG